MNDSAQTTEMQYKAGLRPLYFVLLAGGVALLFLLNLAFGSVDIPLTDIIKILAVGTGEYHSWHKSLTNIRLPVAVTAILAGSVLSVGGLQMQILFRNPLAGPSVLGITSGASLEVAAVMLVGGSLTSNFAIQQLSAWGS